ncbi:hypothetical protein HDU96_005430 [Phlyctochytrium bullatum]|nr:hypothetical protein HDU96_005430 [Phlyctochytrium bullatum]
MRVTMRSLLLVAVLTLALVVLLAQDSHAAPFFKRTPATRTHDGHGFNHRTSSGAKSIPDPKAKKPTNKIQKAVVPPKEKPKASGRNAYGVRPRPPGQPAPSRNEIASGGRPWKQRGKFGRVGPPVADNGFGNGGSRFGKGGTTHAPNKPGKHLNWKSKWA